MKHKGVLETRLFGEDRPLVGVGAHGGGSDGAYPGRADTGDFSRRKRLKIDEDYGLVGQHGSAGAPRQANRYLLLIPKYPSTCLSCGLQSSSRLDVTRKCQ